MPLLVACLGWWFAGPLALVVARIPHADIVRGFYPAEEGALGSFRWSGPQAELTLPARPLPAVLELRGAVAPGGTRVTLLLDGVPVALPSAEVLEPRRYLLLWPAEQTAFGLARIAIEAEPGERAPPGRPLGLALAGVVLRPLAPQFTLPPLGLLAVGTLGAPLLAACLVAAGLSLPLARTAAALAASILALVWTAQPLALQSLALDLEALFGTPAVLRWLAVLFALGLASVPITAFLFRTLPLRGLLFARCAGYVLVGWACWYASAALRIPFGVASIVGVMVLLGVLGCWGLRSGGVRELGVLARSRWRVLLAGEALFLAAFCFGLWLRWNGAVGPAISGTEKPMDLVLLHGVMRDGAFPPLDLWFSGHAVNYYYLGYVQVATVAALAGVSAGEAFNLGMATLFGLTALAVAGIVASLCALEGQAKTGYEGTKAGSHEEQNNFGGFVPPWLRVDVRRNRIALAALGGVVLVLLAGNQIGVLQIVLGGSQVRVLDGGQLAEALWQRVQGAGDIRLSRPTPPAPDFGVLTGWTPAAEAQFDWWSPSRIVMDDIATPDGTVRRPAITEFPFFSFFLGDLHAHLLALPHGLLVVALALALLARPTLPVYFATRRGWLKLGLTAAVLGSLYAVNAWDAPAAMLLFAGALALLYRKAAGALDTRSLFVHAALVSLGLAAVSMTAVAPFMASYRSPFGAAPGPQPWEGVPLLGVLGRVLGPVPAHTGLHSLLAMFGLFLLPLLGLATAPTARTGTPLVAWGAPQAPPLPRWWLVVAERVALVMRPSVLGLATAGALVLGLFAGFPLLTLLPLALLFARRAWDEAARPARALALWGAAVGALLVFAADSVYVRDQLEGTMSRYITVFKFYFQAWVLWGTFAAYAAWAIVSDWVRTADRPQQRVVALASAVFRGGAAALWLVLLAGALVYPLETLRRGERWAPSERVVDGLAFLARDTPDDAAGVAWLAGNVRVNDVVLTAWCECRHDEIGRVAAAAGVSTLLGRSEGHQRLWRAGWPPWVRAIDERERDIGAIYAANDTAEARALLAEYGVDYVYVGTTERAVHEGAGLERLGRLLEPVFEQGVVRIYRVPQE
jgi:YYY domain-containing protein